MSLFALGLYKAGFINCQPWMMERFLLDSERGAINAFSCVLSMDPTKLQNITLNQWSHILPLLSKTQKNTDMNERFMRRRQSGWDNRKMGKSRERMSGKY